MTQNAFMPNAGDSIIVRGMIFPWPTPPGVGRVCMAIHENPEVEDIKRMGKDPIVFAMANPVPEILPEQAEPHVAIMATGRSDYPNQINNVLCFPGIFK